MGFWNGTSVVVAGGAGFIGSYVVDQLVELGARVTVADRVGEDVPDNLRQSVDEIELINADLMDLNQAARCFRDVEVVINVVAKNGGVGYNAGHAAGILRDNILLGANILEAARLARAGRFLTVSSACVYPPDATVPTPETQGFLGDPEPENFGYGWAKRAAEIQSRAYADEFGMDIAIVRPTNAYGPRAQFDPKVSHVVASLIKRVFDDQNPITVWGDGEQTRAFLYAGDFARGLIETIEKYPMCDPVNICTDEQTKIKDLVETIIELSGKNTRPFFDTSKPSGSPRRICDSTKAKEKVGFVATTGLREGLQATIDWYKSERRRLEGGAG